MKKYVYESKSFYKRNVSSAVGMGSVEDEVWPVDLVAVGYSLGPDVLVLLPCTKAEFVVSIGISVFHVLHGNLITVRYVSEALGDLDSVFLDSEMSLFNSCAPVCGEIESVASIYVEVVDAFILRRVLCNGKPVFVGVVAGIHDLLAFELVDARTLHQGLGLKEGDAGAKTLELGGIDRHEGACGDAEQE